MIITVLMSFSFLSAQDCDPGGEDNNICLDINNTDGTAGSLDIFYSSAGEITFLQFILSGISITGYESASGTIAIDPGSGGIIANYGFDALPSGDNLLLMTILYTPEPVPLDAGRDSVQHVLRLYLSYGH